MAKKAWSVRTLVAGWAGYWAVLAAATLIKPIGLLAGVSDQPPNTADASFNISNTAISASIHSYGKEVWSMNTGWLALALWIAGPPLLIWAAWVWRRSNARPVATEQQALGASTLSALQSGQTLGDAIGGARGATTDRMVYVEQGQPINNTPRDHR